MSETPANVMLYTTAAGAMVGQTSADALVLLKNAHHRNASRLCWHLIGGPVPSVNPSDSRSALSTQVTISPTTAEDAVAFELAGRWAAAGQDRIRVDGLTGEVRWLRGEDGQPHLQVEALEGERFTVHAT